MSKLKRENPGLLDYLAEKLEDRPVAKGNAEYDFFCPFCIDRTGDESSKRKLGINLKRGKAHCFRCGYSAFHLTKLFRDLNGGKLYLHEIELLKGEFFTPDLPSVRQVVLEILYGDDDIEDAEALACPDLPPFIRWLADEKPRGPVKKAFDYLKRRGISHEKIVKHDIAFCPKGSHAGHLIFPVHQGGQLVYWTTRTVLENTEHKSKNPYKADGFYSRNHVLYNYDNVIGAKRVEIAEGPIDTLAFPNGVGGLGKKFSDVQIELLVSLVQYGTEEFVIGLDAGTGPESDELYAQLVDRVPKLTTLILEHGDPDERKGEIEELLQDRRVPTVADRVRARLLHGK